MPTGKESDQVTLVMSKELKAKLKEFAKLKRWSMSQAGVVLIEEGLAQVLSEFEQNKDTES